MLRLLLILILLLCLVPNILCITIFGPSYVWWNVGAVGVIVGLLIGIIAYIVAEQL